MITLRVVEVVQLYLNDVEASVERPVKELKGFTKVKLQPGETRTADMKLNKRDLSLWDVNSKDWLAEPGEFRLLLGASLQDIRLKTTLWYSKARHSDLKSNQ